MFRSRSRPILIPQYEHGRLAGELALHWGNGRFGRPSLNFESFVEGVALHDWHYGFGDTLSILGADEADWLAMARRGLDLRLENPVADLVAKLHIRRLLSYDPSPTRRKMMAEVEEYVAARLPECGHTRGEFDRADSITRFCDNVAFHFCFEAPFEQTISVENQNGQAISVTYGIQPPGRVFVNPWPFSAPVLSGIVLGFRAEGYPEHLDPVVVPYRVAAG